MVPEVNTFREVPVFTGPDWLYTLGKELGWGSQESWKPMMTPFLSAGSGGSHENVSTVGMQVGHITVGGAQSVLLQALSEVHLA